MSQSEYPDGKTQNVEGQTNIPDFIGKTCFVIMPYGQTSVQGPEGTRHERQHFDDVYDFICDTVKELGITPLRSDRRAEATPIHGRMLTDIIDADLAIVDVTNHNPNVFYELGVRHTARRHSTLLIGHGETRPPFNLSGIRVIVPFGDPNPRLQAKDKVDEVALCDDIEPALTPSTTSRFTSYGCQSTASVCSLGL